METVPKGPPGMRTHFQNKKFTILITGIFFFKKRKKEKFHEIVYYGCSLFNVYLYDK